MISAILSAKSLRRSAFWYTKTMTIGDSLI